MVNARLNKAFSDFLTENTGTFSVSKDLHEKIQALKPGDKFIRAIAGVTMMTMVVREVTEDKIVADAFNDDGSVFKGGWEFSRTNGGEIDIELGWDPPNTPTGSFIKEVL